MHVAKVTNLTHIWSGLRAISTHMSYYRDNQQQHNVARPNKCY